MKEIICLSSSFLLCLDETIYRGRFYLQMDLPLFLSLQDGGIILYWEELTTTEWSEAFSSEEQGTIVEGEY